MKIGIYGGTFNPIHLGHTHIMTEFYNRLGLDKILVIPAKQPPHKAARDLAPEEDRLEMCRIALKELPLNALVSDIEIRRRGKSYTADTLLELKKIYPEDELFLIVGEDMFMTIDKWVRPEVIFSCAVICGSPRSVDGYGRMVDFGESLRLRHPAFRFIVEDIPYMPAASTDIRLGKSRDIVPKGVAAYISSKGLYA